jgi:hypothetical protein
MASHSPLAPVLSLSLFKKLIEASRSSRGRADVPMMIDFIGSKQGRIPAKVGLKVARIQVASRYQRAQAPRCCCPANGIEPGDFGGCHFEDGFYGWVALATRE